MPPLQQTLREQQLSRSDEMQLLRSYSRYLKLRKVGFPATDARHMAGFRDEADFARANQVYQHYL